MDFEVTITIGDSEVRGTFENVAKALYETLPMEDFVSYMVTSIMTNEDNMLVFNEYNPISVTIRHKGETYFSGPMWVNYEPVYSITPRSAN